MQDLLASATLWLGLAVFSAILAHHLKISIALVEICVGAIFAGFIVHYNLPDLLHTNADWVKFIAGSGAVLLTFLAGAELEPKTLREKFKEVSIIGAVGFLAPFLGCSALAFYVLNWDLNASLICGIALSTTSMAVVYAVLLETGLNKTKYGKSILGSCFVNDLGTVVALGVIFAPFTVKSVIFIVTTIFVLAIIPKLSELLTRLYAFRTAAIRTKWIIFVLFFMGFLAVWSGSEAVLPAYLIGMRLAEFSANDNNWLRRLRTLTVGYLTPFYFIRAGTFVSFSALMTAPLILVLLLAGKVVSKIFGLYPIIKQFYRQKKEHWYYTLLMSTGLTFGTISALYGLSNNLITNQQYTFLVATVIASAVIPTMIAGMAFIPRHLLKEVRKYKKASGEIGPKDEG